MLLLPGERLLFFDLYDVETTNDPFLLGAVWTTATRDRARSYRQVHDALRLHRELMLGNDLVLLGDFNNEAKYRGFWTDLIELVESFGLVSAYHTFFGEDFGKETRPTHSHKGKVESPFHLDYCFVPRAWGDRIEAVSVGSHAEWADVSDHMPLVLDVVTQGSGTTHLARTASVGFALRHDVTSCSQGLANVCACIRRDVTKVVRHVRRSQNALGDHPRVVASERSQPARCDVALLEPIPPRLERKKYVAHVFQ